MDNELFTTVVLDEDEDNIMIVTNSVAIDFCFALFQDYLDQEQLESLSNEEDQESLLFAVNQYTSALVDEETLEEFAPTVTQVVYAGSTTVIVLELDDELVNELNENYEDLEEVEAQLEEFFSSQGVSEGEEEDEDEESDEEDADEWDIED